MRALIAPALAAAVCWAGAAGDAAAQDARQPLLIDGKSTLYERVLTRPGAMLNQGPGSGVPGTELPPFTILYVYERLEIGGETLLAVGPDARGTLSGFVDAQYTVRWDHAMVLAFSPRAGRDQVLFFRDRDNLQGWLQRADLSEAAQRVRARANAGELLGDDSPIISIEPQEFVDFTNPAQFYLLPVLEARQVRLPSRKRVMGVQIASVTRQAAVPGTATMPATAGILPSAAVFDAGVFESFRAGIVFVIDASSSMQPYIDETRQVVHEVLSRVQGSGLADAVRVGVVGYRDDDTQVPNIEYFTQTFADPNDVTIDFLTAVRKLEASPVSTRSFDEDAFAGINHAMTQIDWNGYDGRFVVLITDASARDASSPYTTVGLNPSEMRNDIQGMSRMLPTALFTLHLMTPEGRLDHPRATAQYTELSRLDTGRSLYYPVGLGDRAVFRQAIGTLANAVVSQIQQLRGLAPPGEVLSAASLPGPAAYPGEAAGPAPTGVDDPLADLLGLETSVGEVGRAMALAYLGRAANTQAPAMFRAWASDKDFGDPTVAAFSVRVLLSKSQLSDLQRTMETIVRALNEAQANPQEFFNQLKSASAAMQRDPTRVGQGDVRDLASSGLMGEYLEGLPFQSRLMSLTQDDWMRMGVTEQQSFIDGARAKIDLYQNFHDDVDRWIQPSAQVFHREDYLFPVPLDALP